MTRLPIFQVDAFTCGPFTGNPAAVVLLEEPLPDATLLAIAAANNLSETAYLLRGDDGLGIRWFTPLAEADLCGHATLASAHVAFAEGLVEGDRVEFSSMSGPLAVEREGERLVLDFPARPAVPIAITDAVSAALRAQPVELHEASSLLAVFADRAALEALAPDMAAVAALDTHAVTATAPGDDCDFVSRYFAPAVGVPEDPVTGSAHCTLTPYWSARLGKRALHARQLSKRGGELWCEDRGARVRIGGRTREFLRGEIGVETEPGSPSELPPVRNRQDR